VQIEALFHATRSFDFALDRLADEARALGFDGVDYAYMPRARGPGGDWHAPDIVSRNFPPRWTRGWARYAREDPYLWTCYRRTLPLDWNDVKSAGWLSDTQRQAIAFIDGLGFLDGITVPIHLPGGSFAFVSALSHRREGAWRAAQAPATEKLFVLAHAFHAAVADHVTSTGQGLAPAISRREREILAHAARGLSAPATARAVQRSVETVRRQRKSAMAKLGAPTITAAVARAIALGLVEAPAR
jgi:DNA-binding CsgD family transcriptional regulator